MQQGGAGTDATSALPRGRSRSTKPPAVPKWRSAKKGARKSAHKRACTGPWASATSAKRTSSCEGAACAPFFQRKRPLTLHIPIICACPWAVPHGPGKSAVQELPLGLKFVATSSDLADAGQVWPCLKQNNQLRPKLVDVG